MNKSINASNQEPNINLINEALNNINTNNIESLAQSVNKMTNEYPNGSTSWLFLAIYLNLINKLDQAEGAIKKSLFFNENYGEAYRIYSDILRKKNDFNKSLTKAKKAVEINSNHAPALDTLGTAYASINDHLNAEINFRKALELDDNNAVINNNLGNTLRHLGKNKESIFYLNKALKYEENAIEIHSNLALSYFENGDFKNALITLDKINEDKTLLNQEHRKDIYTSYGHVFSKLYEYKKAISYYKKALKLDPEDSSANNGLAEIFCVFRKPEVAIKYFKSSIKKSPKIQNSISNYILCYNYLLDRSEDDKFKTTVKYANFNKDDNQVFHHENTLDPDKKINIGFVSGDFYNHPVSYFLKNPVKNLKNKNYKIFAYNNYNYSDIYTESLREDFHVWRNIFHLSDQKVLDIIKKDKIDILFDLSGHTARNSLNILQKKPSPVQISWLGYSKTTGLKEIDYILSDEISIPEEEETLFIEKPIRMKNSYYCFSKPMIDVDIDIIDKKNNELTLGCFNNVKKLNDEVLTLWSKILNELPESKLLLKFKNYRNSDLKEEIKDFFIKKNVRHDQIVFENESTRIDYLKCYNKIDLALDPFPYPGGTTTCEALYMGVPVVTMRGNNSLARNSQNILMNCKLSEYIVNNKEEYLNFVINFSKNINEANKFKVREKFLNSNLINGKSFAHELDIRLREIWKIYCKKN